MTKQELIQIIKERQSFLCVGLDTDLKKVPTFLLHKQNPIFEFNKAIIDATAPYCVAFKPNLAFYECFGMAGWTAFDQTITYLQEHYPHHLIIADAKRGDIGNTSKMYARAFFDNMDIDAITVAPYMGKDSVTPFLGYKGKWVILLALTSNEGSQDFQLTHDTQDTPLYENVITKSQDWATDEEMMYVVGATQGKLFNDIRRIAPHHFLLVPGVGAQGGSLQEVCKYGMTDECGLLINSSRGIIYASEKEDFAEKASLKAKGLQEEMKELLKEKGII